MSSKLVKITLNLEDKIMQIISALAQKNNKSIEDQIKILVAEALDNRKDFYFSNLVDKRSGSNKKLYSHEEAWK